MRGKLARLVCLIFAMLLIAGVACAEGADGTYAAAWNQANGIAEESHALAFVPGTYEAQAPGYGGEMKFAVTVGDNAIEAIEFISGNETKTVGTVAIEEIPARVLAAQTLGVGYFLAGVPFAESHGAQLMTGITGKALIVDDNNRVVGVKAVKKDGTAVTLHANKGVVLATGGYAGNTKLVQELDNYWNGGIPDTLGTTNTSGITGDGLQMATAVGANLVGTDFTQLLPSMHPVPGVKGPNTNPETTIFVNKNGRRFVNEYAERDVAVVEVFKQPGSMYYTIDDDHMTPTVDPINLEYLVSNGFIWRADSIEDLAAQIDMDPVALRETVDSYNRYVDQGKDPEFGKNVLTSKIETPPFYAVPRTPGLHHTMGGVQIDTQCRVISVEGQPIAGLYAGGEVTGGIQGANRLGGNATADAIVFGRIAGASASEMK